MEITFTQLVVAYSVSLIVSLLMIGIAWKWQNVGRFTFVALFLWAGIFNLQTAASTPEVYVDYGAFTFLPFYRNFIYGFFAQHVAIIVSLIAITQLLIGIAIASRGAFVKAGLTGAIIFLIAIAPLGAGSAFPSTLLMAFACFLLVKKDYRYTLFTTFTKWLHKQKAAKQLHKPRSL